MGGKNNCCRCVPPPDILIEGMTGGEWVPSISHPCCWARNYTYNEPQDWILKSDEITRNERLEYTSVFEYLEYRQDPIPGYKVATSSYGELEECPVLPSYPFYDCGTWVKAATRTIHELFFGKNRQRFWTKQKDVIITYSHSAIACDEDPDTLKFIVQVKQRFWWSFARQQNALGPFDFALNTGYDSSYVLEPCFAFQFPGTPPTGWVNNTYPPTEDVPWIPLIDDPDDWNITEAFVVKTKVYNELPETDIWTVDDPHTLECWSFCGNFDQRINPIDCIQEAEALTPCDYTISEAQHNIAPTGPGINPSYTCGYCNESGSWVFSSHPAILPDCSSNSYLIDILTPDCSDIISVGLKVATHTPMLPKTDLFYYNCGPDCVYLSCADTPLGWSIATNGAEKCSYALSSSNQTLDSQVSFDIDFICERQKSEICHAFITLTLDFNL